ncbi:MAG: hypothetical protein ABEH90_08860 [Halolamina sp.]
MLLYCTTYRDSSEEVPEEVRRALRNSDRRAIVEYLYEREGEAPVTALASHLAAETSGSLPDAIATLCDLHLPKLEEPDLVEYDLADGVVALDEELELIETALERV